MDKPKFIGTIPELDVLMTIGREPWQPLNLPFIPYQVVTSPPGYLTTLGSGCVSLATTSVYGQEYVSGIDVFRQDWLQGTLTIDLDHYVARPFQDVYAVYKEPPTIAHHLTLNDPRLENLSPAWRPFFNKALRGEIYHL